MFQVVSTVGGESVCNTGRPQSRVGSGTSQVIRCCQGANFKERVLEAQVRLVGWGQIMMPFSALLKRS